MSEYSLELAGTEQAAISRTISVQLILSDYNLYYVQPQTLVEKYLNIVEEYLKHYLRYIESRIRNTLRKINIRREFSRIFDHLTLLCTSIAVNIDLYIIEKYNIEGHQYVFDVYSLGENEIFEERPCILVYVPVDSVDEMLNLWEEVINYLKTIIGEDTLEFIDVFFTRA